MIKLLKLLTVGSVIASSSLYAVSTSACTGCHGANFEKKAMGQSKVVKDMSKEDIVKALKGYKDGSYGAAMKAMMKGQVASLSDADMESIADSIKGGGAKESSTPKESDSKKAETVDINAKASDAKRIEKENKRSKKEVTEETLGLRKTNLYTEGKETTGVKTDYSRPAPGQSTKFERAYVNAPPMIPHSVDGLLPITQNNNQCIGCHMPESAKAMGATPIPVSHFTNYRPTTVLKDGELVKEGHKVGMNEKMGNTSDIVIAKAKKSDKLYQGRFNCSQCHAPQSKVDTVVGNTFKSDGLSNALKSHSNLADAMNEGIE